MSTVGELEQYIRSISPDLWAIAAKQVQVMAIQTAIMALACIPIGFLNVNLLRICRRSERGRGRTLGMALFSVGILASGAGFLLAIYMLTGYLANPSYYALLSLARLLR